MEVALASCTFDKFELALGLRDFFAGGFEVDFCVVRGGSEGERRELMSIANEIFGETKSVMTGVLLADSSRTRRGCERSKRLVQQTTHPASAHDQQRSRQDADGHTAWQEGSFFVVKVSELDGRCCPNLA